MSNGYPYRSKPLSRTQRQLQDERTLHAVNACKMVSVLTLRNQGWGETRIRRFNEQFNDILRKISNEDLSLSGICDTIYDETGLTQQDLCTK